MDMEKHSKDVAKVRNETSFEHEKSMLLSYLEELLHFEALLWDSTGSIKEKEERTVETANHLLYLLHNDIDIIEDDLKKKEIKEFIEELKDLKKSITDLRGKIVYQDRLRNLINSFTLKITDKQRYKSMEDIYLLERQLNEVIEIQEKELYEILLEISNIENVDEDEKEDLMIDVLKRVRSILSGHLEHHGLWEKERREFSNTSNILNALIKKVEEIS